MSSEEPERNTAASVLLVTLGWMYGKHLYTVVHNDASGGALKAVALQHAGL